MPQGLRLVNKGLFFLFGVENGHQFVAGPDQHLQIIIYRFVLREVAQEAHERSYAPPFPLKVDKLVRFEAQLGRDACQRFSKASDVPSRL